jgi:hypothetical protein
MKVKGSFNFMGAEKQQSRDGKETYHKIGLMQGLNSKIFYIDQVAFERYSNIPVSASVDVDLSISERDGKTYYQIDDLQVVTRSNQKAV